MGPITIEQIAQLGILKEFFEDRNKHVLAKLFRTETIWDDHLLADEECYAFFQEVHAHNLDCKFVNFTCIYAPPIDQDAYGIEDVRDILEEKQKEETFVFEVAISKNNVTERKIRSIVAFANHLGQAFT